MDLYFYPDRFTKFSEEHEKNFQDLYPLAHSIIDTKLGQNTEFDNFIERMSANGIDRAKFEAALKATDFSKSLQNFSLYPRTLEPSFCEDDLDSLQKIAQHRQRNLRVFQVRAIPDSTSSYSWNEMDSVMCLPLHLALDTLTWI